jgi:hypothetical protein
MKNKLLVITLSIVAAVFSIQASAHHSVAKEYAINEPLQELVGTVTKVRWSSPHVVIYMKITEGEYKGQEWSLLGHAPGLMARQYHIPPGTVKVGAKLRTLAWVSRFGVPRATPRAVSVDGSPMMSTLRSADSRDTKNGTLGDIIPAVASTE